MNKIVKSLVVGALLVGGISATAQAGPDIDHYEETYAISKTGYTRNLYKQKTGSNAICNNKSITGATSHTAVLVNSDGKVRSSTETVSEGQRKVLKVSTYDGSEATAGYKYKQKHVVTKLGVFANGTFAVDDKNDF